MTTKSSPAPGRSSYFSLTPDGFSRQAIMALLTAFLLILSFPNFNYEFLAWIALAPLLQVIAAGVSVRRAFCLGWLSGMVFTFFAENWIAHSMTHFGDMLTIAAYAVALLFAAVLAIFPAIFAAAMSMVVRRFGRWAVIFAPAVWVATEWLRPFVTGVTWNALGVSQAQIFPVARLSRYGGAYLISAEIVAASALIILTLKLKERSSGRAAAILLMSGALFFTLPQTETGRADDLGAEIRVVGVQPNLPPDSVDSAPAFERELENSIRLTRDGIKRAPDGAADLVVWAESPLTLFYENDAGIRNRLDSLARETGSYFILNTVARDGERYFNSVSTISPRDDSTTAKLKRYDKIRLVPFGEYVPWRPVLGRFVPAIVGDFTPGKEATVNHLRLETQRSAILSASDANAAGAIERTTQYIRTGSFICYESAYPNLVRRFVQNGATLLINVSNDAWFGNTAGARQHLAHAIMRAIENDRYIIRVTNTGITAMISSDGRVADQLPAFAAGSQVWQAQSRRNLTFYTINGDWFAIGCSIVSVLALAFTFIRSR